jgi:hypothetical protein
VARKLEVEIVGDASSLRRALGQADTSTSKFSGGMKKAGKAAGIGLAAGVGVAVVALKSAVGAALEAEKAEVRLGGAFASVKATAKERQAAQEAVNRVSREAALDDEDLSDVLARLTRSTGDVTKAQEGMALAANIARARNISLEAASKTVERAMLGNETALKRVGVEVTKNMTTQEALAKAQKQFAGAAEAYGDTAAGAQERFKVATENLQESIGKKLLPVLAVLAEKAQQGIVWLEANWPRISDVIKEVVDRVRPAIEALIELIVGVVSTVREHWGTIGPIVKQVVGIVETYVKILIDIIQLFASILRGDWSKAWGELKSIVGGTLAQVRNIIELNISILGAVARKIGTAIKDAVVGALQGIGEAAWGVIDNIRARITERLELIAGWGRSIANAIKDAVVNTLVGIGEAAWAKIDNIRERIAERLETIAGWGRLIANAIKNALVGENGLQGIGEAAWGAIKKIGSFLASVDDQIKDWGRKIGKWILLGLFEVIKAAASDLTGLVLDLGKKALDKLPGPNPLGGGDISDADVKGIRSESVDPRLWRALGLGSSMGLSMVSGYRPGATVRGSGNRSDHSYWPSKAIDMAGAAMGAYARAVAGLPGIDTVIYSPLGLWKAGSGWGPISSPQTYQDHFSHVHVDTFGKGGIVPGAMGQPRLIMAHGGETVLPTHKPMQPIQVNLNLDGTTLAKILVDPLRREAQVFSRQNGRPAFS